MSRPTSTPTPASASAAPCRRGRLAAASGIILGVTYFAGVSVEGPDLDQTTGASAQQFFTDNATALRLVGFAGVVTVLMLLIYAAHLRALIGRVDPHGVLGSIAYAGALLTAGWFVLLIASDNAAQALDPAEADPQLVLSWYGLRGLNEYGGDVASALRGLFITAVSVAALRNALLPRWLGWLGLAIGVASLLPALRFLVPWPGLFAFFFVGMLGFGLWAILTGIALTRHAFRDDRSAIEPTVA